MLENYPLIQVIISLIILLLMGYIGYNIYLIELQNMFQGENDIRKETTIISGVYDFSNGEVKYNTGDKTETNFKNIKPSINQEGGAEYSYNFWLSIDQEKMSKMNNSADKDILLFLKGEKNIYYNSKTNYNCGNIKIPSNPVIITEQKLQLNITISIILIHINTARNIKIAIYYHQLQVIGISAIRIC